ncbi:hypothetical protein NLU13_3639 [Sarocladium strictum]|uniref:Ubiquitin-like protease family profile domain-containing protein n=1 Tax=Sarocladium strictum TaxID=5046 RepID=A0AA39GMP4_SARSR|nr:hypothetical protein NLU13_3639 [Sarocladium strictum]
MVFGDFTAHISTMVGLFRASINSLRSLAYGTPKSDNGSIHAKPSSSHSDLRLSLRTNGVEAHSDAVPASTARDIPGAFPGEREQHDSQPNLNPADIPLPESLRDDDGLTTPITQLSPLHTPGQRKRKRAATDLPSKEPRAPKEIKGQIARERPRSTTEKFLHFLKGKSRKAHDDSDKENDGTKSMRSLVSASFSDREQESRVSSVLRERNQRRRPPKHLQPSGWAKKVWRPVGVSRPTKRPRFIPARTREYEEDSEDELAGAQAEEPKADEVRLKATSQPMIGSPFGYSRKTSAPRPRRGDIDSLFNEPDVISMSPLELSNGMQALIEETKRIEAEQKRAKEEAERKAEAEKKRKLQEERLARSGGLRIPKQPFVVPVGDAWERRAYDTLSAAPNESLASTAEGTELRRHDFAKVVPSTVWLNDEIVNGALLWLDRAINSAAGIKDPKKQTRKCLALSSFFWKRLVELQGKNTQRTLRRSGVEPRNFLDIETILLPICESNHWTLVVVRPTKRTVAYMDSMRPDRPVTDFKRYTSLTLAWLRDVLGPKFEEDRWKVIRHDAPRQNNGYDCGVFTITNAMCVALGLSPIDSYREEDMPVQRIRIACMLLNNGFSGDFDLKVY